MRSGRLRWFGHVQRRDADNVTRRVMNLAIPGTRRRGRPKKKWHQQINDDMMGLGVALEIALNRKGWRRRTQPLEYEENAIKVSIFTFSKKSFYHPYISIWCWLKLLRNH